MAKIKERFQNKLFFHRSVSGESTDSILCSILKVAVSEEKQKGSQKLETFDMRKEKGFLKNLSPVMNNNTISEWVKNEFTYETGREKTLLWPYHASAYLRTSEAYDAIFEAFMRAGRAGDSSEDILRSFINYFKESKDVDDLNTKLYIDLSEPKFINDEGTPKGLTRNKYSVSVLCKPHARLFQNDVETILSLKASRRELLDMLISVISYHFCAYIVRMGFAAAEHERTIRNYAEGDTLQHVEHHKCYTCNNNYSSCIDISN